MSEIKVSDQRGRRLSGRRSVDFAKQKCGRDVGIPPPWRQTIGRCSLLEAKCCKSVAGTSGSHHHGAKALEGVHFWSGNEAKVLEGIAKRLRWAGNVAKVLEGNGKVKKSCVRNKRFRPKGSAPVREAKC